jgi:hypothetical protein
MNVPSLSQTITFIPPGTTVDYGTNPNCIMWADIALPENFNGADETCRTAFVSVATRTLMTTDGVYRVDGTPSFTYLPIPATGSPAIGIRSVDFKIDLLVAGEHAENKVWHSHNALGNPVNWTLATTQPNGQNEVVVDIGVQCQKVFAGTSGPSSGISRSHNIDPLDFQFLFGCAPDKGTG